MARKAAAGTGTIRKKSITRNGKKYEYWEARYTAGYDPGTGKQIQRSITGKTQKEVAKKLKEATAALDAGTYTAPSKITVGEWLDVWAKEYLGSVKPLTVSAYKATIKTHLKPGLGAIKLEALNAHTIQGLYNSLSDPEKGEEALSPKTIKNVHGVLHKALQQAVSNGYIRFNPTDACILPRIVKKEIKPLDESQISTFLKAIRGHKFEDLFTVTLFTGMREGEALGLTWDCVDLAKGTIVVNKQLQLVRGTKGEYCLAPTKNSKGRTITLAPFVVTVLRRVKNRQLENRLRYGELWNDTGFVFTNELGQHLIHVTVYKNSKKVMDEIGRSEIRFHDLRHSYAVASIKSGDDIKTVQENLGHATASFTLDVYGHVTEQMKQASAARMEQFIRTVNR
ncbi:MAG: tyrosine-type recombinase/integrase [Candidatus Faecousia sp.]|nr:tyrosine-type recombinase/integrase [Candidatus Faecousia sp.]